MLHDCIECLLDQLNLVQRGGITCILVSLLSLFQIGLKFIKTRSKFFKSAIVTYLPTKWLRLNSKPSFFLCFQFEFIRQVDQDFGKFNLGGLLLMTMSLKLFKGPFFDGKTLYLTDFSQKIIDSDAVLLFFFKGDDCISPFWKHCLYQSAAVEHPC